MDEMKTHAMVHESNDMH